MYHPTVGRFINRDPIGYVDGENLYAGYFVPGSVDPFGTQAWKMEASEEEYEQKRKILPKLVSYGTAL
jgi:uncharacterized protein RhaS with RHS repeats